MKMTEVTNTSIENIILAALNAADRPLSVDDLAALFQMGDAIEPPSRDQLTDTLTEIESKLNDGPVVLKHTATGYRLEVPPQFSPWVSRLWAERPTRYSRALLETLALIAYRQPITRPEIEAVRGVAVNTQIIRTLAERNWIRIVGHRDVPGRPALYGTTKDFLDYFGLQSLEDLPSLAEIRDAGDFEPELPLEPTNESRDPEMIARPDTSPGNGPTDGRGESRPAVVRGPWGEPDVTQPSNDNDQ